MAELGRRWSPYVYAFNNPIKFTDPDGMWPSGDGITLPLPKSLSPALKRIPGIGLLITMLELNNASNEKIAAFAGKLKSGELRGEIGYDGIFGHFVLNKGLTDVGKVGTIPDLNGKSLEDVDATLKDAGFKGGEPTEPGKQKDDKGSDNKGGYRTYKNEDGSTVTIKPDGSVVRETKPEYDPISGQRVNKGEKLIKTEDGFKATRDQKLIHENRELYPERVKQ